MNSIFSIPAEVVPCHSQYSLLTHARRLEFLSQISSTHENPPLQQLPKTAPSFLPFKFPSQTHGGGASTWSSIDIFVTHSTETHKPTSPTIDHPLGAPSSFLLNFRPSPFLQASPPRIYLFTQPGLQGKEFNTHPIEP